MNKNDKETDKYSNYEELISQTGIGCMRDWGNGMMSVALGGNAGCLWSVRMPDGSLAVTFVWEHHELWYANIVVFTAGDKRIFECIESLGPYPTMGQASTWAGKKAGMIAKKYTEEQDDTNNDDGYEEENV